MGITKIEDAVYLYENDSEYAEQVVFAGTNHIVLNRFERFGKGGVDYYLMIYVKELSDEQIDDIIKNTKLKLIYETEWFGVRKKDISTEITTLP